ncbi:hypothetical protein [Halomicrococcus sp. NG-SE-24]
MATDDSPEAAADLSPKEARQQPICLITCQDIDDQSEIYDDLARE